MAANTLPVGICVAAKQLPGKAIVGGAHAYQGTA